MKTCMLFFLIKHDLKPRDIIVKKKKPREIILCYLFKYYYCSFLFEFDGHICKLNIQ
jgi:hypothetical protein